MFRQKRLAFLWLHYKGYYFNDFFCCIKIKIQLQLTILDVGHFVEGTIHTNHKNENLFWILTQIYSSSKRF